MKSKPLSENVERAFYHDGYQLGLNAIKNGDPKEFSSTLTEMYESIDKLTDSLIEFACKQGQTIACHRGCEWCCHQPVFALDYELEYLSNYLAANFSPTHQEEIKIRAIKKQEKLNSLKGEALLNAKYACPLLQNGACIAYSARPMACRIYLSTNLNSCLNFFHEPEDKNSYPTLLDFPMRAGRLLNEGFKAALKTKGVIAKEFRIEEKLM